MATTAEYLTQLQKDKTTLVTNLVAKGVDATNDETFTSLVPKVANISTGGSTEPTFTGSYDRVGLKQIGWTDEEINYYNQNGVQWNASEDEYFKLTQTELAGDDSKNTRFIPKNSTKRSFDNYFKLLAIPQLDTSNVSNMNRMFYNCYSLTTIPQLNTNNVTSMGNMFSYCYSLTRIPELDTSNVTSMNGMFSSCNSLTRIPQLDTSKVIDMISMFYGCGSLTTIPQLNTSKVNNTNNMFNACSSLKAIPQLDTSNVTNMNNMFYNCYSLKTIPELDTSKAIYMSGMFGGCYSLTTIPQLNTNNVTSMGNMFNGCNNLTTLDVSNFDTSNVTNMASMFNSCKKLTNISKLKANKIINISSFVYNCTSLTDFGGLENLGQSYSRTSSANYLSYKLDLSTCTALTEQSLINVLTNLYDIATKGCKTQQVILGSTNLAKLTSTEGQSALAQATAYGWTVS